MMKKVAKIDNIFLVPFEAGHTYMADIREYLTPVGQSRREVSQVNTFKVRSLWQLSGLVRRKATHLHKSPHTQGLLMRKISKSQPFSDFLYPCGNETLFPSEK